MEKIVVTGGSGRAGRAVVKELREHGYKVLNADIIPPKEPISRFLKVDLTDLGQTFEALQGYDGIVHMAAFVPISFRVTEALTFRTNTTSNFNLFYAAAKLGIKRIVWASSESILGLPFIREQPAYVPIDEDHPLYPESSYALSKVLSEEMARQFSRWNEIPYIGLRISNIKEAENYQEFPEFWTEPGKRRGNLWGYVDARDVAQSCRLGLEADIRGAEVFDIAAADTIMNRPSHELMAEFFPGVPVREDIGEYETLLSIDKARKVLGYDPKYSWRDYLQG